jgi:hypothetical protein
LFAKTVRTRCPHKERYPRTAILVADNATPAADGIHFFLDALEASTTQPEPLSLPCRNSRKR